MLPNVQIELQNFGVGFYEGITGLVSKPIEGAKQEGTLGLIKGIGKGSVELMTKPGNGKQLTSPYSLNLHYMSSMNGTLSDLPTSYVWTARISRPRYIQKRQGKP